MSVALGRFASGIFSNDDGISETMSKAGFETNERVWRMPMWKEYADLIKGTAADIRNTSTARGEAGSITGAKFLEAFVSKGVKWVHVDIASTDVAKGHQYLAEGNGAGPGVRLTLSALRMMAKGK
jgi:leucyl aminopeptidase